MLAGVENGYPWIPCVCSHLCVYNYIVLQFAKRHQWTIILDSRAGWTKGANGAPSISDEITHKLLYSNG